MEERICADYMKAHPMMEEDTKGMIADEKEL